MWGFRDIVKNMKTRMKIKMRNAEQYREKIPMSTEIHPRLISNFFKYPRPQEVRVRQKKKCINRIQGNEQTN